MSNGSLPVVYRVASDLSVVWPAAQRLLNQRRSSKIGNNFDWERFGVLDIMKCNGHIADGDHRHDGAVRAFGRDVKLPCHEHDGGEIEAARLFVMLNSNRVKPSALDIFKNSVTGMIEPGFSVDRIMTKNGYRWGQNNTPSCIRAVNTCVAIYNKFGEKNFSETLRLINKSFGRDVDSVDKDMLLGFSKFLHHYPDADKDRLTIKASKNSPTRILANAKNWQSNDTTGHNTSYFVFQSLVSAYNSNLHKEGGKLTPIT